MANKRIRKKRARRQRIEEAIAEIAEQGALRAIERMWELPRQDAPHGTIGSVAGVGPPEGT